MSKEFELPDFDEASSSQIPALLELVNLGYSYIPRAKVAEFRESNSQYILRDIAFEALRKINPSEVSGKSIRDEIFKAEQNIDMGQGVFKASEEIYSLLLAGVGVSELIDGRRVSPQMKFVDWKDWRNNTFHVCAEFELSEGTPTGSSSSRRPDIVLFVNGIPFAVIENKKESVKVAEAVTQMVRNQGRTETPKFFLFPQLLIATNVRELKYATMLTPSKFYTHWKEKDADPEAFDAEVSAVINKPVEPIVLKRITKDLLRPDFIQPQETQKARKITEQDKGIYALLRPERMLDLVRNFILYDNGIKKVARYQQVFAIKKALARLKTFDEFGRRRGGLIWHTQGSGKSLTMVMLVKGLIDDPEIELPRVLVVTDRKDLDKQIADTFAACNIKKDVKKTTSSKELLQLIREKDQRVITALIHKFEAGKSFRDFSDDDPNVFVLIDEAHRSQAGQANTELNIILPKACQIAFTGTPLMRREKSTEHKFGGMIDAYTISEAEADEVVLPLIYQPRFVEQHVQQQLLDRFYDQITQELTEEQKKDLQQKFNSSQIIEQTSQRIETIALDILEHFKPFVDTGLKAQVVAPSKYAAVMFQKAFDLQDAVQVEVVVSDTNDKEEDDQLPEHKKVVAAFLADEKHKHGSSLDSREKKLVADFKKNPDGVRMLIVVDKLLTGFDAPRNTFLYLAKQLKDHNLLQAIARVNRLFDGDEGKEAKVNGVVIDYSMNAKNLRNAMQLFSNYDPEDVDRALLNTEEKIHELERIYQELHSIFNSVRNKQDTEGYIRVLEEDVETRENFYDLVNEFIKQFSACQMLFDFTQKFDAEKLRRCQMDLKKFVELKKIQKVKNAETVDFSKYEDQIRRILDKYVTAYDVQEMAEPICISESAEFNAYIDNAERGLSEKSKAEAIAAQTKRTIKENYHKDPEFYKRFSEKIEKLIEALKAAKEEDARALLEDAREIQGHVVDYEDNDIPSPLKERKKFHTYYRNLRTSLEGKQLADGQLTAITEAMVGVLDSHKIIDWHKNVEVQRRVRIELEDYLFDVVQDGFGVLMTIDEVDKLISLIWDLAVENKDETGI
ncbi:MAG: type I restriction endonuclease subunit R [Pontiellaceae bacterium]|nr:type I restriction endonuclease subunit R [Pontiellaceae bacterium]